jgi:hypothetical protein
MELREIQNPLKHRDREDPDLSKFTPQPDGAADASPAAGD